MSQLRSRLRIGVPEDRGLMLQRVVGAVLGPPVRVLWPVRLKGYEAVPANGAAILCPNHLSFFDAVLLTLTVDRPLRFIGKIEYLESWKTRYLLPALGMIPIDRQRGMQAMITLDTAGGVLARGGLLCIFPEGSRSRDGDLHRGYTGAARLALDQGCPILPVGITGTREVLPPQARVPRPGRRCSISIGAPMPTDRDDFDDNTRIAARTVTDRTMLSIAALSGQIYVADYTRRTIPPTSKKQATAPGHRRRWPNLERNSSHQRAIRRVIPKADAAPRLVPPPTA